MSDKLASWNYEDVARQARADAQGYGGYGGYGGGGGGYGYGQQQQQQPFGGSYDDQAVGGIQDTFADSPVQKYMREQREQQKAQQAETKAMEAKPGALSGSNIASLGQGRGGTTGGKKWVGEDGKDVQPFGENDWNESRAWGLQPLEMARWTGNFAANLANDKDNSMDLASSFAPGMAARSLPGMAKGIKDDWDKGNYKSVALQAGLGGATTGYQAYKGVKGLKDTLTAGGGLAGAWNTAKGFGGRASAFTKAIPGVLQAAKSPAAWASAGRAAKAGLPAAKVMPGVGAALSVAGNASGAYNGDQNYISDGFWGQMGEQALRTGGDLMAAKSLGPAGFIGVGAGVASNVIANTGRAAGAVYDAAQSGRDLAAFEDKHRGALDENKAWRASNDARKAKGESFQSLKEYRKPGAAASPAAPAAAPASPAAPAEPAAPPMPTGNASNKQVPGAGPTGMPPKEMHGNASSGATNQVG